MFERRVRLLLNEESAPQDIDLQTPLRKNRKVDRPKTFVPLLMKKQQLIKTVIGQLTDCFHIEKVRARDSLHFSNQFIRKLLAHT